MSSLTPDELAQCRALAKCSVREFSSRLGLTGDGRALREMEAGKRAISGPVSRLALILAGLWPYGDPAPQLWAYVADDFDKARAELAAIRWAF